MPVDYFRNGIAGGCLNIDNRKNAWMTSYERFRKFQH